MAQKYSIVTPNPRFAHLAERPIAFFSAEYAMEDELPTYAGGLGVLAGDFLLEAGEAGLPVVAVGLLYRRGFSPGLGSGEPGQVLDPREFGYELLQDGQEGELLIPIELDGRPVYTQVWFKAYGTVHMLLLDTFVAKNASGDRVITSHLYPNDFHQKLLQEVIFGIGGVKLLRKLGINPSLYHLQEGRMGFVCLALAIEYLHDHPDEKNLLSAIEANRSKIVVTKHTVLPGVGMLFTRDDFRGMIDVYLSRHSLNFEKFFSLGAWDKNPDVFSMTKFLLFCSVRANAVSVLHAFFEKESHPKSRLTPITNGIRIARWSGPALVQAGRAKLSDQELWRVHSKASQDLVDFVNQKTKSQLHHGVPTIVWARRLVAYKRPLVLLNDQVRLTRLVRSHKHPVQFIISGKPHGADQEGLAFLKQIIAATRSTALQNKVVYLPDYSLASAKYLVAGADVWLNTPMRGHEACGTSGMKACLNGALLLSTSDGWVDEVDWQGRGWVLPETDIETRLYDMLEQEIIPLFYERGAKGLPIKWLQMMRSSMALVQKEYSTKRVLEDYINKLYFPDL